MPRLVDCLLKILLISYFQFFTISILYAENTFKVVGWDASRYPEISVDIKANIGLLPKEHPTQITEEFKSAKKIITNLKLTEKSNLTPVHIYLSIPSYANWEEKKWLLQFANHVATIAEKSKGKFFLNVQADDQFLFYEDIPSSKLGPSFSLPKVSDPRYPLRSWDKVMGKIRENDFENRILILLSLHTEWEDKFRIADFAKNVNHEKIDFLIVAPTALETTKLASYVNGKFFQITSGAGITSLFQELNQAVAPQLHLVYLSAWDLSLWSQSFIKVNLIFDDKTLEFDYELSPIKTIYNILADPFVSFPILIFFIIVCFSILYYLRGYRPLENKITPVEEKLTLARFHKNNSSKATERNRNELEVYDRVYGEIRDRARENEIISQMLERDEITGEIYHTAVLIFKLGSVSGDQFPITQDEILIGRGESCDLVLFDPNAEIIHSKIKKVRGRFLIFDFASETGVFLNGKKLLRPKALYDLDEIKIGKTIFSFRGR